MGEGGIAVAHRTGRRQCLGERLSVVKGFGRGGESQGIRFGRGVIVERKKDSVVKW
jgi:hypothetical protein